MPDQFIAFPGPSIVLRPGPTGITPMGGLHARPRFALQAVSCTNAGVVLARRSRRLETAVATDPAVEQAGQLQIEYGEGTAVTAAAGDRDFRVYVSETTVDHGWPASPPVACWMAVKPCHIWFFSVPPAALDVWPSTMPSPRGTP